MKIRLEVDFGSDCNPSVDSQIERVAGLHQALESLAESAIDGNWDIYGPTFAIEVSAATAALSQPETEGRE